MDWGRSMDARPYECLLLAIVDLAFDCAMNNAAGSAGDHNNLPFIIVDYNPTNKNSHTSHLFPQSTPSYLLSQSPPYFQQFPSPHPFTLVIFPWDLQF